MAAQPELFLVAYDISCPRRLRRVHRYLKKRAVYVQYSVCVLEASRSEAERVRDDVAALIDPDRDDVRFYRLDPDLDIAFLGASTPFPEGVVALGRLGTWVKAADAALAEGSRVWDKKAIRRRRARPRRARNGSKNGGDAPFITNGRNGV